MNGREYSQKKIYTPLSQTEIINRLEQFESVISLSQADQLNDFLNSYRNRAALLLNEPTDINVLIEQLRDFGLIAHAQKFMLADMIKRGLFVRDPELVNLANKELANTFLTQEDMSLLSFVAEESARVSIKHFGDEISAEFMQSLVRLQEIVHDTHKNPSNRFEFTSSPQEIMIEEEQFARALKLSMMADDGEKEVIEQFIAEENEAVELIHLLKRTGIPLKSDALPSSSTQTTTGEKKLHDEPVSALDSDYLKFKRLCASRTPTDKPDPLISLLLINHQKCLAIHNDPLFKFDDFMEELTRLNLKSEIQKFQIAQNIKIAFDKRDAELIRTCTRDFLALQLTKEDLLFFVMFAEKCAKDSILLHGPFVRGKFNRNAQVLEDTFNELCRKTRAFAPQETFCLPDIEKLGKALLPPKRNSGESFAFFQEARIRGNTSKNSFSQEDNDVQEAILLSLQSQAAASPTLFQAIDKKIISPQREIDKNSEKKSREWRHRSV